MVNQQILEGRWNELKGKLQRKWGQLTDKDLPQFHGNVDELVGKIQQRTGEGREAIENYLQQIAEGADTMLGQTAGALHNAAHRTADQIYRGYDEARRFVRERPSESLAVCFAAGMIVGVIVAVTLRGR